MDKDVRRKLRTVLTLMNSFYGFRPPPEPEEIAVSVPGPDRSGAGSPDLPEDAASGLDAEQVEGHVRVLAPQGARRAWAPTVRGAGGEELQVNLPDQPLPRRDKRRLPEL